MKQRFKAGFTFIVILLLTVPVLPDEVTKVGSTASPFLKIGVGARPVGLGGAYVSLADDASALYWNVGGIAQVTRPEVIFNHSRWLEEISFDYLGLAMPLGSAGVLGISFTSLSMGEFEQTTELDPEGNGVLFSAGSFAVGLSYARQLTNKFMIGFTGKYIQENIWNSSAKGFALDVGTLFTTPFDGIRLGMSISNFGTKMQMNGGDLLLQVDPYPGISGSNDAINALFQTGKFDLPLLFRVGLSWDALKSETNRLTLAVDALHPNDNSESVNIGGEYTFNNFVSIRGGYQSLFQRNSEEGFTVGAGLNTGVSSFRFVLDYAYQDFGLLDNVQLFTVRLSF